MNCKSKKRIEEYPYIIDYFRLGLPRYIPILRLREEMKKQKYCHVCNDCNSREDKCLINRKKKSDTNAKKVTYMYPVLYKFVYFVSPYCLLNRTG